MQYHEQFWLLIHATFEFKNHNLVNAMKQLNKLNPIQTKHYIHPT